MTYTFSKGEHHPLDGVVSESTAQLGRNPRAAVPPLRYFGANRRSIEQPKKPVFMSVASTLRVVRTITQKPNKKKALPVTMGASLHMLRQIDEYCMDSEIAMAYR